MIKEFLMSLLSLSLFWVTSVQTDLPDIRQLETCKIDVNGSQLTNDFWRRLVCGRWI
ncbi:hypothetical protein GCM10007906_03280 [Vibrio hyugaensis]|uniref:Uncharacterized protein n=1 Tax=Vibrio hyugaensis TaxID=1534743 RepID=A0ABQ5XZS7_9VIBR|nr:hypothetical protein GCM10007906_03280 [Vibrio hyugaensis]